MATVEIDETEVVNSRQLASAVQKMLSNPESRKRLLEAQKIVNPNAVIPEIDSAKPFNDAIGLVTKKITDLETTIKEAKEKAEDDKRLNALSRQWETGRTKVRESGYTAEGIEELEKFMEEKGIADHEIAMPAFERIHPPEKPVATGSNGFDVFQSLTPQTDDSKLLLEGSNQDQDFRQFLNKAIPAALKEARGR